ncbi:PP2C family protein-serine/threonine phosphatase [Micromonosporaceae bacterium Da 78-11]
MSVSQALQQLLRQSHHARPEDLPEMAMSVAPLLGADSLVIYLVDHQQRVMAPLLAGSAPPREPIAVDGTLAGRAFTTVTTVATESDTQLWLPLVNGSERMGVLEVCAEKPLDAEATDDCAAVAAVLAELDQRTGILRVISAGHPGGIVLRHDKAVKVLPTPTALPVTLGDKRPPAVVQESLEPGDMLLLYTDGIVEARTPDGEAFGLDRLIDFAGKAAADRLPAPETVRRLVHAILAHQDDRLQDDATVLLAQWRDPAPGGPDIPPLTAAPGEPLGIEKP